MIKFFREYVGHQVWCCVLLSATVHTLEPFPSSAVTCLQIPLHLREDFCGTALVCAVWCKTDVRRTATGCLLHESQINQTPKSGCSSSDTPPCAGLDIDREALQWGARNNAALLGGGADNRLCLLQCNVSIPQTSMRISLASRG